MYVTVEEFIAAAEKNGYQWSNDGTWVETDDKGYVTRACVLGQAAINLGIAVEGMWNPLNSLDPYHAVAREIYWYNDTYALNYDQAVAKLKEVLEPYKGKTMKFRKKRYKVRRNEVHS